jgi:hypothetical protein
MQVRSSGAARNQVSVRAWRGVAGRTDRCEDTMTSEKMRSGAEAIWSVGGRFIAWRRQVRSELGKVVDGCASRRVEAARTTGLAGVESRVQEAVVVR